jgi:hypothetical protein
MSTISHTETALRRSVVDALLERYVAWREECEKVWRAYHGWADADRHDRGPAHANYLAALDREESAAREYAALIERVGRISS